MSLREEYKKWSNNCFKLAELLRNLPKRAHNQSSWTNVNSDHICGTSACAMGWAVLSEQFEGLSYAKLELDHETKQHLGIEDTFASRTVFLNGRATDYENAAAALFGRGTLNSVFMNLEASRDKTVAGLETMAQYYCDLAKTLPDDPAP